MDPLPQIGCSKDQLDTPVLCVDLQVMEQNIASLVETCRQRGVAWRPHTKCHKSPLIARKLLQAGAMGVTCAKLGEAEVMARAGIRDILIANMIVGPQKMARLAALRKQADPIVCVDHVGQLAPLGAAAEESGLRLRVLIEVDIGMRRVGVLPGADTCRLAERIARMPALSLAGIMGYEGHLLREKDPASKARLIVEAIGLLVDTKRHLEHAGLPCPIVSCGGTGSFQYTVEQPGITELQAGGAIFMDAFYRFGCHVQNWSYALTVTATVVSRPAPDRAVIDAGRKAIDANLHAPLVCGRDDIQVESLSAEHGTLRLAASARGLRIGDRIELIPGYSDMTCVLHNYFCGFRSNRLEVIWPLEARGRLQ